MLFGSDSEHAGGRLRAIRDIVEIVAIIAAGIWAFYVFIYENRIVPARALPAAEFSATLEKVGEHDGLIGVRLLTRMHNIGTVTDNFLGFAVAVTGQRITPAPRPKPMHIDGPSLYQISDYDSSTRHVVFAQGLVTSLGDKTSKSGLPLEPGAQEDKEYIFYVKSGEYDRLEAYMLGRFIRDSRYTPTTLVRGEDGLPTLRPKLRDDDTTTGQIASFEAALDLHSR